MAVYSTNYFQFDSGINSINVPGKSTNNANKLMASNVLGYTLTIKELGNKEEQISAAEIGLQYNSNWGFGNPKDRDNLNVLSKVFINNEDPRTGASYDKKLLRERLDRLSCFDESSITEPKNPGFRYTDGGYVIVDEVSGNKVDKDILCKQVVNAVLTKQAVLDLESAGCYIKPQYTSKSQEVIKVKNLLNKYVSSSITYTFGEHSEIIDGSIINTWLIVDENFGVAFDEQKIRGYINALSNKYGAARKSGNFVTTSGKTLNFGGGGIDTVVNAAKETQELIDAIRLGKTMTKEPAYVQAAYVEIDLTNQHLWFYKNGWLITEGDIVSGNLSWGMATPAGAYRMIGKKRNAILRGPGYAAPVDFWMPFNGGIGIHDATWRDAFGGSIYTYDGSHGCINCPYNLAETIFNNITDGTPVICYY